MQYLAIALVWVAFVALIVAVIKRRKDFTIAFLITAFLAVAAMTVWGALRNF